MARWDDIPLVDEFVFDDAQPQMRRMTVNGKRYVVCEADAGTVRDYKNAMTAAIRVDEEGRPNRVEGIASLELMLVGRCTFAVGEDGTIARSPVGEPVASKWKYPVIDQLHRWIQRVSGIMETDSLESLVKQRDALQARIDKMEAAIQSTGEVPDPLG